MSERDMRTGSALVVRSMADEAYNTIEVLIIRGEIPQGSMISEVTLSKTLGIGRTPVREALQRLVRERMVTPIPRQGIRVNAVDIDQFLEGLEIRREIERVLFEIISRKACRWQRRLLLRLSERMAQAADTADINLALETDRQFKQIQIEISDNPFLTMAVRPFHAISRRVYFTEARTPVRKLATSISEIMKHCAHGDTDAALSTNDKIINALIRFGIQSRERSAARANNSLSPDPKVNANDVQRLSSIAYNQIEDRIIAGRYRGTEKLSEGRLCEDLGLGRTPVREALQHLAARSLITILPRRGVCVVNFERLDFSGLIEALRPLERMLALLVCRNASPAFRRYLLRTSALLKSPRDICRSDVAILLDRRLEKLLVRVADQMYLQDAIVPLHSLLRGYLNHAQVGISADILIVFSEVLDAVATGKEHEARLKVEQLLSEIVYVVRADVD
ncbi:GntR family transcriptional regulator [Roseovarius spongiae]|uniref:GntR family transcriptional regulator n=1 Tax=Roseovarius spongiae TaxID=2320272 RepID=A0A3A8B7G8_9RHOB|nr:GntR family transcriptional regulator [Roseovarius spongiae]RKF12683.1 GntR family transcriptional regulator [Roseovarius spongiae]